MSALRLEETGTYNVPIGETADVDLRVRLVPSVFGTAVLTYRPAPMLPVVSSETIYFDRTEMSTGQ